MNLTLPWKANTQTPLNGATTKLDQIKRTLSGEAEHIAEVAAQFGRDAGAQTSKIADEVAHGAGKAAHEGRSTVMDVGHSLVKGAAELGAALAATGRKTAADLGQEAHAVASDLRKVRITTEPKKTGPDFMPGITLLGGFGAGIALMYFLDPEQGKRRRSLLRDQLTKWTRVARETASSRATDLGNRTRGAMLETRGAFGQASSDDAQRSIGQFETNYQDPALAVRESEGSTQFADSTYSGVGISDGSTDGSTTDTWGEQPQSEEERTSTEIR